MTYETYSQLDGRWGELNFPGTPADQKVKYYGCLLCCIATLIGKTPVEIMSDNPEGWNFDGNMRTDQLLAKYGYKIVRQSVAEGAPLPQRADRYIARTSYLAPKYPTHFYIVNPDNTISDVGSMHNPKAENRYALRTNEIRFLQKIGGTDLPPQLTLEQRVTRIEQKLGL